MHFLNEADYGHRILVDQRELRHSASELFQFRGKPECVSDQLLYHMQYPKVSAERREKCLASFC